jgi:hypothetical protein
MSIALVVTIKIQDGKAGEFESLLHRPGQAGARQ